MNKPICTAANPAPLIAPWSVSVRHSHSGWNDAFDHPDATREDIGKGYEDYEYTCPHCRAQLIEEGADG